MNKSAVSVKAQHSTSAKGNKKSGVGRDTPPPLPPPKAPASNKRLGLMWVYTSVLSRALLQRAPFIQSSRTYRTSQPVQSTRRNGGVTDKHPAQTYRTILYSQPPSWQGQEPSDHRQQKQVAL